MNITRRTLLKSLTALLIPVSALDARAAAPVRSYVLNRFFVAGFQFYDGPGLTGVMKPGDRLCFAPNPITPTTNSPSAFCGKAACWAMFPARTTGTSAG